MTTAAAPQVKGEAVYSADGRLFEPGSAGWTVHDLDEPALEFAWFERRYELIDGVITKMAAAYFMGGTPLLELILLIRSHAAGSHAAGRFGAEIDIVIDESRVVKADAAWLTPGEWEAQKAAAKREGLKDVLRTRVLVPPAWSLNRSAPGTSVTTR